ncbi:MAG: hypothetical protein J1F07_08975, partial [Muribaculaceae bacterium]|nr:hypothetical protein [Muribaculaceae bacterium]MCH5218657.1 hypothetical protein [Muribaculaceae bacterium]
KTGVDYLTVPVYLEYQYRALDWLGLWARAGVGLAFRTRSFTGGVSGLAKAWGVFPEYDDLLIDEDYLDDFGERTLSGASNGESGAKGFGASIMVGAGLEFYVARPVSFLVGVTYDAGLTNVFPGGKSATGTAYTAETAPVTYTVAGGTQVRSLADYTSKSKLMPLCLQLGVNVRF